MALDVLSTEPIAGTGAYVVAIEIEWAALRRCLAMHKKEEPWRYWSSI